jgi:hypothetical protein
MISYKIICQDRRSQNDDFRGSNIRSGQICMLWASFGQIPSGWPSILIVGQVPARSAVQIAVSFFSGTK